MNSNLKIGSNNAGLFVGGWIILNKYDNKNNCVNLDYNIIKINISINV